MRVALLRTVLVLGLLATGGVGAASATVEAASATVGAASPTVEAASATVRAASPTVEAASPTVEAASATVRAAAAASTNPTPAQIRRAVARAERARTLWATVNVCDTRRYPNIIGVRGQMPGLGFPAWLSMKIQVNFYDKSKKRFVPDPKAVKLVRLGRSSSLLQQGGAAEQFPAHSGYFNATIQFIWRRSGNLLGETTRRTTAGHRGADFGDPKHYTAKQCLIR